MSKYINCIVLILITCLSFSCKKYLEVDLAKSLITTQVVYSNDITAISAVRGMYSEMLDGNSFASPNISKLCGLSADEFVDYTNSSELIEFEKNILAPENSPVNTLWASLYKSIYNANSILTGLQNSSGVTVNTKKQLEGEAKFVRALCHFYLVNLYGNVPLITTIDYQINQSLPKTSADVIYQQIISDLESAQSNLSDVYESNERVRPNKETASALLARVYLFRSEWLKAETESSKVINDPKYSLESDLYNTFLKSSMEAIWQLRPVTSGYNTYEAEIFIIDGFPQYTALRNQVINSFETDDNRLTAWTGTYTDGVDTWYYPYKYKARSGDPLSEYTIVLRLAEQYLIRAEARAQLNNITGSQEDINAIRKRAGLGNTSSSDKNNLLSAIEQERRVELFTEWGHRWLDLKRWGRSNAVLSVIKTDWNPEDVLYPLPKIEMNRNPNLKPQNPGY